MSSTFHVPRSTIWEFHVSTFHVPRVPGCCAPGAVCTFRFLQERSNPGHVERGTWNVKRLIPGSLRPARTQVVPVQHGVEDEGVAAMRFPPPEGPVGEKHNMTPAHRDHQPRLSRPPESAAFPGCVASPPHRSVRGRRWPGPGLRGTNRGLHSGRRQNATSLHPGSKSRHGEGRFEALPRDESRPRAVLLPPQLHSLFNLAWGTQHTGNWFSSARLITVPYERQAGIRNESTPEQAKCGSGLPRPRRSSGPHPTATERNPTTFPDKVWGDTFDSGNRGRQRPAWAA